MRARAVFISRTAAETGQAALKGKGESSGAGKPVSDLLVSDSLTSDRLVPGTSPAGTCWYQEMWAAFECLPEKARDIAFGRLAVLIDLETLMAEDGFRQDRALRHMAQTKGLSRATLYIWLRRTRDVPREHWLPFLIDRRVRPSDKYSGRHSGNHSGHSSGLHTVRGKQLDTVPCPKKQNDEKSGDKDTLFEPSPENHGAVHADTPAGSSSPCTDRYRSQQAGDTQPDKRSDKHSDKHSGLTGNGSNSASPPSTSPYSARLGTGAEDHETPGYSVTARPRRRACPDAAFDMLKADWLRPEKPSFMSCYRRLEAVAGDKGWVLPSSRSLYRQMVEDVPVATRVFLREGPSALKRLWPAQQRDRSVFHAMEAVNADGHRWDVFVNWPETRTGESKPVRPVIVAIQDLYSGKILAWRIGRRETTELVLLLWTY